MSDHSKIEWTHATWNPTTGCTRVSAGCDHCYIDRTPPFRMEGRRFSGPEVGATTGVLLHPDRLTLPLRWRKPRRIFVNSLSDLFHTDVRPNFIAAVFATMSLAPQHTFQVLTKRHARMRSLLSQADFETTVRDIARSMKYDGDPRMNDQNYRTWPLPNVHLGVSVEDQHWADLRIPALLDTPAAVRWISAEPLLGPVDLTRWLRPAPGCGYVNEHDGCCFHPAAATPECHTGVNCPVTSEWRGLDWIVVGGESGKGARPMHPQWSRGLRDQCAAAGVPFHFKQWGEWGPGARGADIIDRPDRVRYVRPDGQVVPLDVDHHQWRDADWALMSRVGKNAAGRGLDGRTHDGYPAGAS